MFYFTNSQLLQVSHLSNEDMKRKDDIEPSKTEERVRGREPRTKVWREGEKKNPNMDQLKSLTKFLLFFAILDLHLALGRLELISLYLKISDAQ